ncbi:hypothetical protein [Escherichia sp. MOD1-EC5948]|uniref:hypothetical protein n=1 Tax=Escherichia sp. MOD1-EC5948 TaxID=2093877 RepID=UPI000CF78C82|nr:hypothetical protein [Escherichia sp. MOD1-EC5948]
MATLSDTIKPNKTYLEAVLRTALLGKTEDEYVDFFLSGLRVTNGAIVIHTQRLKSDPGGNLLS